MHFLVVDSRFASPVHVFLESDPRADAAFPKLGVQCVTLEPQESAGATDAGSLETVGQAPWESDRFRQFPSERAVRAAGFSVVEPRFVGPTWAAYDRMFGFGMRRLPRG